MFHFWRFFQNSQRLLQASWWHICSPSLLSHLSGSPVWGGVYRWPLSPVCWACLHTGTVPPASTLGSDTVSGRRVRLSSSTATLPSPGWTGDSGDNPLPSCGWTDCPQAGEPPQDSQAEGSACPLGSTGWCGTPLGWRWWPPSPDCLGNKHSRAGGSLFGGGEDTDRGQWTCFLMLLAFFTWLLFLFLFICQKFVVLQQ